MKAIFSKNVTIAITLAGAALVTACGQNGEVSQAEQESTSTASTSGASITSPSVESITDPETGATAQTGADTNIEYGSGSSGAGPAADMKAERSGPPAGKISGPHTTTDMLAISPAPAGVKDHISASDASQHDAESSKNKTERTTPDAGSAASQ